MGAAGSSAAGGEIDGITITAMQVSVDMTTLQSDDSRRDERLRTDGLQTGQFPTATFTLTKPIEVGSVPKDGQTIQAVAVGDLTLHGVPGALRCPSKRSGAVTRSRRSAASTLL
jgi:polyisoprenoid-binding protein YceI